MLDPRRVETEYDDDLPPPSRERRERKREGESILFACLALWFAVWWWRLREMLDTCSRQRLMATRCVPVVRLPPSPSQCPSPFLLFFYASCAHISIHIRARTHAQTHGERGQNGEGSDQGPCNNFGSFSMDSSVKRANFLKLLEQQNNGQLLFLICSNALPFIHFIYIRIQATELGTPPSYPARLCSLPHLPRHFCWTCSRIFWKTRPMFPVPSVKWGISLMVILYFGNLHVKMAFTRKWKKIR